MKLIFSLFPFIVIFNSCQNQDFCSCYKWRGELLEQYEIAKSKDEKKKIEEEMSRFDKECEFFQEYTSNVSSDEDLKEYFKKVKECESD